MLGFSFLLCLALPHVWNRIKNKMAVRPLAGGVVTNLREVLVPMVTSQRAEVKDTLFSFLFFDRLETPIMVRKYW